VIAVVDYGVGNLGSALKAFRHVGADAVLSGDPDVLQSADALVLPGDGAFGATMDEIDARGLAPLLRAAAEQKKPLLGICVGMQVLFEDSDEQGAHRGLGLLRGSVRRLRGARVVPHMGWNTLDVAAGREHPILDGVEDGAYAYFVHSYACAAAAESVVATTSYGGEVAAIVAAGSIVAMQFHPEKSQAVGLRLIENFVRWSRA
jgi:glutamine amidotransferase